MSNYFLSEDVPTRPGVLNLLLGVYGVGIVLSLIVLVAGFLSLGGMEFGGVEYSVAFLGLVYMAVAIYGIVVARPWGWFVSVSGILATILASVFDYEMLIESGMFGLVVLLAKIAILILLFDDNVLDYMDFSELISKLSLGLVNLVISVVFVVAVRLVF